MERSSGKDLKLDFEEGEEKNKVSAEEQKREMWQRSEKGKKGG